MTTIKTHAGVLETSNLPDWYEPIFCSKCGDRIGWGHTEYMETDSFAGVCDDCAAVISQDHLEDI